MKHYIWLLMFTSAANAALVSFPSQKIKSIRVEGSAVLVGFENSAPAGSGCGGRVWITTNDDSGRAKYSLALSAFTSDIPVSVRADNDEPKKMLTECALYDIVVSK